MNLHTGSPPCFPLCILQQHMQKGTGLEVSLETAAYMGGVLEYLCAEVCELAGAAAQTRHANTKLVLSKRAHPQHESTTWGTDTDEVLNAWKRAGAPDVVLALLKMDKTGFGLVDHDILNDHHLQTADDVRPDLDDIGQYVVQTDRLVSTMDYRPNYVQPPGSWCVVRSLKSLIDAHLQGYHVHAFLTLLHAMKHTSIFTSASSLSPSSYTKVEQHIDQKEEASYEDWSDSDSLVQCAESKQKKNRKLSKHPSIGVEQRDEAVLQVQPGRHTDKDVGKLELWSHPLVTALRTRDTVYALCVVIAQYLGPNLQIWPIIPLPSCSLGQVDCEAATTATRVIQNLAGPMWPRYWSDEPYSDGAQQLYMVHSQYVW